MTKLDFEITFHTPFRVALGEGSAGVHDTVSRDDPLPSHGIKGVMRATAKLLLGKENPVVAEVFGSDYAPSPWRWSSATPQERWYPAQPTARVNIDPDTHTARDDMLSITEQTGAATATFNVTQFGHVTDLAAHQAVLVVAAQATRSLGALRRRGLGWVGIRCTSHETDEATVRRFLQLRP
ncbi:RAMP superfamily CRISPR-associated protein [Saccharopolyspora sp. 5N708]|uniref:RAMP superfamily CRISPR-associated protein n=1 Tax=Saccharopolyspora sp. 5N708 TaxID=3457424 RepID=UPI003FD51EEC